MTGSPAAPPCSSPTQRDGPVRQRQRHLPVCRRRVARVELNVTVSTRRQIDVRCLRRKRSGRLEWRPITNVTVPQPGAAIGGTLSGLSAGAR